MTNRLKSIHRTIPRVQPLLVISLPTISKIAETQKTKTKTNKQANKQTHITCRLSLAKEYNIFCDHAPYTLRRENCKTEKCNILYKFVIQNKL